MIKKKKKKEAIKERKRRQRNGIDKGRKYIENKIKKSERIEEKVKAAKYRKKKEG